jgi:hypothetical protein
VERLIGLNPILVLVLTRGFLSLVTATNLLLVGSHILLEAVRRWLIGLMLVVAFNHCVIMVFVVFVPDQHVMNVLFIFHFFV